MLGRNLSCHIFNWLKSSCSFKCPRPMSSDRWKVMKHQNLLLPTLRSTVAWTQALFSSCSECGQLPDLILCPNCLLPRVMIHPSIQ